MTPASTSSPRRPRRSLLAFLTVAAVAGAAVIGLLGDPVPAAAQSAPPVVVTESMKQGRQILDDAIAGLGGDRFRQLRTKTETGRMFSFENEQLSGLTWATIYTKYSPVEDPDPGKMYLRERQTFGKDKDWSVLFTGDDGYEITFRGVRPMREDDVKSMRERRRSDIFYILLCRLNEPGLLVERRSREIVDNFPMELVDIFDNDNNKITAYFSDSTKLPARVQFETRDDARVRHVVTMIYDKYLDSGNGIKLPWIIQRQVDGERVFSIFAEEVKANVPIADSLLTVPEGVEMLERQP